jgi:hypothetical protein
MIDAERTSQYYYYLLESLRLLIHVLAFTMDQLTQLDGLSSLGRYLIKSSDQPPRKIKIQAGRPLHSPDIPSSFPFLWTARSTRPAV